MTGRRQNSIGDRVLMALVFLFLYAPIIILIVFSFNAGTSSSVWKGFSLKWYESLLSNRLIMNSVYTTLMVSLLSTIVAAIAGTFAAIGLYLLYINFATGGHWFLTFALPVTGTIGVLVTTVVTLLRYVPSGTLYTLGGGLILAGGYAVLVEFLLNITFHLHDTFLWSFYPLAVCVVLGVMLLVVAVCKPLRRSLHKKFFI